MEQFNPLPVWSLFLFAYIFGSIPWGLVLTRFFSTEDIRKHGSGNIGATNVRRIAGSTLGVMTLIGDMAKGAFPVYLAIVLTGDHDIRGELYVSLVALSAFMGHLYPCFLRFKGGKGVATAAGCFLVISPVGCLIAFLLFSTVLGLSNRASAGSLSAAAGLPMAVWWTGHSLLITGCAIVMAIFIFFRHQGNIRRLISGTEPVFRAKER